MTDAADHSFDVLIGLLIQLESEGNPNAIGDNGSARGILQIRQPCLDDVNRYLGTKLTLSDVYGPGGVDTSKMVFSVYMHLYATEKRLGRPVTDFDRARIWNGGPNGYKKSSTRGYLAELIELARIENVELV